MARWESFAVRALGSLETELTVLGRTQIGPRYLRVEVDDGGLLAQREAHPTMWLRLWFADDGRDHQRAYTLVAPDPEAGRFSLDFSLHDGAACTWARSCAPGDTIRASLLGSKAPWAAVPRRTPDTGSGAAPPADAGTSSPTGRTILVGDICALPAIRSLLGELTQPGEPTAPGAADEQRPGDEPAVEVWLEHRHAEEAELPVPIGAGQVLHRVHRTGAGTGVAEVLEQRWAQRPPGAADRVWIALEATDTRRLNRLLRAQTDVRRDSICATAYWRQS